MSFYQTKHMICLTDCSAYRICIRININTIWNSGRFTARHIFQPAAVILIDLIHTITASNNCKIYAVRFHCLPVNLPVVAAHINSSGISTINNASSIIVIRIACPFPCIDIEKTKDRLCLYLRLASISKTFCFITFFPSFYLGLYEQKHHR